MKRQMTKMNLNCIAIKMTENSSKIGNHVIEKFLRIALN